MGFDNRYVHWYFWHFSYVPKHVKRFQQMPSIQRTNGNTRKMSVAKKDDGWLHLILILSPIINRKQKMEKEQSQTRKEETKRKKKQIQN